LARSRPLRASFKSSSRLARSIASTWSKSSKSSGTNWRAAPESGIPRASPTARLRRSRACPTCQSPVPALSIAIRSASPARLTRWRITASAVGERQMFPRQTKQIRTIALP
jgi:hypothetical protein